MKIFLFLIIISALWGCQSSATKHSDSISLETIEIDEKLCKDTVDASFLIDTSYVEVVSLETNTESLIGNIKRIYLKNDKIIIFDDKTFGVYLFNMDGSYYSKIHSVGNGPGEYPPDIYDVFVTDSCIALFCPAMNKILCYSYEGKHLRNISLIGVSGRSFGTFDDNKFHIISNWIPSRAGRYNYFCVDIEKGVTNRQLSFTKEDVRVGRGWGLSSYLSFNDERALAILSTSNTIYEISQQNEICARYYVDILKNRMPDEIAEGDALKAIESGFSLGLDGILESKRYMFLGFDHYTAIYDKESRSVVTMGKNIKIPDIPTTLRFKTASNIQGDKLIYKQTDFYSFMEDTFEYVNSFPESSFKSKYLNALNNIKSEEDNPIITILKFKQ